jgi:hypothetical protein
VVGSAFNVHDIRIIRVNYLDKSVVIKTGLKVSVAQRVAINAFKGPQK